MIAPTLSIRGAVAGTPQGDALNAAFNQVDRFRLVIRRQSNNEVVQDTVIVVTPGQNSYDLSSPVPSLIPNEQFIVTITAMQGSVVLFESPPVTVAAIPESSPAGAAQSPKIELDYSGPGASAASVTLLPTAVLLGPGGTRALTASVLSSSGSVVAGVPLSWSSAAAGVASVSAAGVVTAVGEGATRITVTTPSGLGASGWVYVASGEIAFVQGGHVRTRNAVGGSIADASPGAAAAANPTYGPGGSPLAWSDGGRVFVGGSAVTDGAFPAVSPDGTKLAVERSGRLWFTNINGSNPTEGPLGTSPAWMPDGAHLAIGGGSVQRIKADGTERSTMVAGSAALPALGSGGRLAYTNGGALEVQGVGTVLGGVSGRGAWSPSGRWLIVSIGSDLVLVDPNGVAPAVPLSTGAAADPVWRGAAPAGSSPSLALTALQPSPAIPGAEVRIVGRGFDWIIPANNRIFFPSASGPVPGEISAVTETILTALMPLGTNAGSIRVTTPGGEGTLPYVPSVGQIRVRTRLAGDAPAPGIPVIVRRGAETVGSANTDADGRASFGLIPGDYTVSISPPGGYQVFTANPVPLSLGFETRDVGFDVGMVPVRVTLDPARPTVDAGTTVTVRARAYDLNGNEIASFRSIRWTGTDRIYAIGGSLQGQLVGRTASNEEGDAAFSITLDETRFDFAATVRASITGTVTQVPSGGGSAVGVSNANVRLKDAGNQVIASISTNYLGAYRFDGLMSGSYTVLVNPPEGVSASPTSRSVNLGPNATGQDFTLSTLGVGEGTGVLRPNVMVCGGSSRSPTTFFPAGTSFNLVTGCVPDSNTQALFVTRGGASSLNGPAAQAYVNAGGIVITEYSISHIVWSAIFATAVNPVYFGGSCRDVLPSVVQFNSSDPFWQGVTYQPMTLGETGCGYSVSGFPGITTLAGWNASNASLGYRNLGSGRVWAADFDWQDGEVYPYQVYTGQALGYMMTHRGAGVAGPF